MATRSVVLGANGGTGGAVVEALLAQGRSVRAVTRRGNGPRGAEQAAADVTDAAQLSRVFNGADVVYHCAQPEYLRWREKFPGMNRTIAAVAGEAGVKLVFADNLYMYDPSDGPLRETSPEEPPTARGRLRRAMADELLEMHRDGGLRVTIGRASDYFGPHGIGTALGDRLFEAVIAGKKAQWMGSLDQPHTCSYLPDIARGLIALGDHDDADGRAWILPAAPPITGRRFVELASDTAGVPPRPVAVSAGMMRVAGLFSPTIRAYAEMLYQGTAPFTVDASAFQDAFGPFEVTPHEVAIPATVSWFRERAGEATAA
ncbi:MAG: NAD-dependent epimerase/dehydratase family protein [Actinomycetota bacterium]